MSINGLTIETGVQHVVDMLRRALPAGAVTTAAATLDAFAHDAWPVSVVDGRRGQHPHRPDLVVKATTTDEVIAVLHAAMERSVPVTARGLGSSVTGQPLPVRGGIVLDLDGLTGEPELNEVDRIVTVPAGVRAGDLEAWLSERDLTLNNAPQSLLLSSVGGWVATRETGQLSSKYGGIEHLVTSYTVVLTSGEVVEVGSHPRASVGPDLRHLFLGSEGAFGIVVRVSLRVFARTGFVSTAAFSFDSLEAGLAAMREFTQAGLRPALVRFYDESETLHAVPGLTDAGNAMFLGFDGLAQLAQAEEALCTEVVERHGGRPLPGDAVGDWLKRRFDFSTVERYLGARGGYAETIEVAHLWSGIESLYAGLREALEPLADNVLMHFSHVYDQGVSLYAILLGHETDDDAAAARLREIWKRAMDVTVANGGEISHHHGAGLARQEWIPESLGGQHLLIHRLKAALDPDGILNPGKLGL